MLTATDGGSDAAGCNLLHISFVTQSARTDKASQHATTGKCIAYALSSIAAVVMCCAHIAWRRVARCETAML
jgi:hypothetical protein